MNEHAECTLRVCPTPDFCFEMCKLHRKFRDAIAGINPWQPMINRCNAMNRRINDLLTQPAELNRYILTIDNIDDLETILFAVRYAANTLGEMKMGAGAQGVTKP